MGRVSWRGGSREEERVEEGKERWRGGGEEVEKMNTEEVENGNG